MSSYIALPIIGPIGYFDVVRSEVKLAALAFKQGIRTMSTWYAGALDERDCTVAWLTGNAESRTCVLLTMSRR